MSNPDREDGRNQTPITNTTAYINANKAVIAIPEATFKPIIFHLFFLNN